jgi:hypothetical protein
METLRIIFFALGSLATIALIWPVAARFRYDWMLGVVVVLAMVNQAFGLAARALGI